MLFLYLSHLVIYMSLRSSSYENVETKRSCYSAPISTKSMAYAQTTAGLLHEVKCLQGFCARNSHKACPVANQFVENILHIRQ
jgi:hypothetical protein